MVAFSMKPYMLGTKSDLTKIGSWLCTKGKTDGQPSLIYRSYNPGPYLDYISELSISNPGLRKADPKNRDHLLRLGNAKVVLPQDGQTYRDDIRADRRGLDDGDSEAEMRVLISEIRGRRLGWCVYSL